MMAFAYSNWRGLAGGKPLPASPLLLMLRQNFAVTRTPKVLGG